MTPERFRDAVWASGRAHNLLATAIRATAKILLGVEINTDQARDLARGHTLTSAVASIREKLRLHANVDARVRVGLAVAEATIESGHKDHEPAGDAIRLIRKEALKVSTDAAESRRESWLEMQHRIVELRDEIVSWSDNARRFFRGVAQIERKRRQELKDLNLPEDLFREAAKELENLFVESIGQFSRLV